MYTSKVKVFYVDPDKLDEYDLNSYKTRTPVRSAVAALQGQGLYSTPITQAEPAKPSRRGLVDARSHARTNP